MTVERILINPEGQSDDEVVAFIMDFLESRGLVTPEEIEEARLVEHPGHPDQKVHGRKGGGGTGSVEEKGVGEPVSAANAVISGKSANVTSADLDDAMIYLAQNAPPGTNLMRLSVDGKQVTGDNGLPHSRKDMPQFDGDNKTQFVQEMEASGVRVTRKSVDPSRLTPGQNEIDAGKTGSMFRDLDSAKVAPNGGDPILVSREGRVLDGNHRYAAYSSARQDGHPDITINVIELDMPAGQLLPIMQSWTQSHGIQTRALGT